MSAFDRINDAEYSVLKKAVAQITVLIAGADGVIDREEIEWAEKLTKIRGFAPPDVLNHFYNDVGTNFSDELHDLMDSVPEDTEERNQMLSDQLSKLNPVLAKLDNHIAFRLYNSFVSFAKHIATETGGFFRFGAISASEKRWIGLPMLTEIIEEEETDDE